MRDFESEALRAIAEDWTSTQGDQANKPAIPDEDVSLRAAAAVLGILPEELRAEDVEWIGNSAYPTAACIPFEQAASYAAGEAIADRWMDHASECPGCSDLLNALAPDSKRWEKRQQELEQSGASLRQAILKLARAHAKDPSSVPAPPFSGGVVSTGMPITYVPFADVLSPALADAPAKPLHAAPTTVTPRGALTSAARASARRAPARGDTVDSVSRSEDQTSMERAAAAAAAKRDSSRRSNENRME
jgi:hypothetical protein